MTKKKLSATKRTRKAHHASQPPGARLHELSEPDDAEVAEASPHREGHEEFIAAAAAYLGGGRPSAEWAGSERLGMQLALRLASLFLSPEGPDFHGRRWLEEALFRKLPMQARRARCVRLVEDYGSSWGAKKKTIVRSRRLFGSHQSWEAHLKREQAVLASELVRALELYDVAAVVLHEDLSAVMDALDRYTPNPKSNKRSSDVRKLGVVTKRGAAGVLAALIVEAFDQGGFLGLSAKTNESDEEAIERILKALDKAVRQSRAGG